MKKLLFTYMLSIVLGGCVATIPSIPEGYSGPMATIKDIEANIEPEHADFFYLAEIDGNSVENDRSKTIRDNFGKGLEWFPATFQRPVAVKPANFTIVGRNEYAAPILNLTHTIYQVKGNVQFTPREGHVYLVRGVLGEDYSAVWLEDEATHEVIGQKIEIHGSAKLGTFEK